MKMHYPRWLYIETSTKCNLDCGYCPSKQGSIMPTDKFKFIFEKFDKEEHCVDGVNIIGLGEPLMDVDIIEKINFIQDRGHFLTITTNGTIWNEEFFRALSPFTTTLYVSLDGVRKDGVMSKTRKIDPEVVINNLEKIRTLKPALPIILQPVVIKGFIHEAFEYALLADKLGLAIHPTLPVLPTKEMFEEMYPSQSEIISIAEILKSHRISGPNITAFPNYRQCADILTLWMILLDGTVYPCCFINTIRNNQKEYFYGNTIEINLKNYELGNVFTDSISSIQNNPIIKKIRRNVNSTDVYDFRDRKKFNLTDENTLDYCKICIARWQMGC